jgi:hypothetical protein
VHVNTATATKTAVKSSTPEATDTAQATNTSVSNVSGQQVAPVAALPNTGGGPFDGSGGRAALAVLSLIALVGLASVGIGLRKNHV